MRAVVQRVTEASVSIDQRVAGAISRGVLVYLGVAPGDTVSDRQYIAGKIRDLRIFDDEAGRMNVSLPDVGGSVLLVSQFTLYADTTRGRRPGFSGAAPPDVARAEYDAMTSELRSYGLHVETGVFQAHMAVQSVNDGPVTILIDSAKPL
jgi:D-tyrosyl-tRNA(Tyr) deacylase